MEWLRRAACAEEDPELFFPVGTVGPARHDIAAAKRVCARCPVSGQCLAWALSTGQTSGVWGGTGEEERAALLRTVRRRQTSRTSQTSRRSAL
ncbi:WhiB family transcriptional regulator [Streptomyces phaeochromogenes]|uniref:Transcriptional regulator WhiB n=1 Tax=Streptomyces phaeochromogenes TaxID=1923 RepID=A0ABZ1H4Y5_STRPH|nr:WhiB family transcriptional regulator [Streptomyces phaeochromogenes]MCX5599950.1 WhiB family transcriptional regulator [Streptomyces phaeochromogenes]WRZ27693.1 WhiB family transcriptional regulator [Streptomyces phaeochromogenes]WSD13254.1 WhiB family transcriptional regulator [Streptomyces phaeochromogenes]WSJ09801.1 WhiB family transcriptional regulator [Streptomyces phaeochromogenes]